MQVVARCHVNSAKCPQDRYGTNRLTCCLADEGNQRRVTTKDLSVGIEVCLARWNGKWKKLSPASNEETPQNPAAVNAIGPCRKAEAGSDRSALARDARAKVHS